MTHQFHIDRFNIHRLRSSLIALFLFISVLAFSQWQYVGSPEEGYPASYAIAEDGIYATYSSRIFFSKNDAQGWEAINPPGINYSYGEIKVSHDNIYVIAHDFYGSWRLFKSNNKGIHWEDITPLFSQGNSFSSLHILQDTLMISWYDSTAISFDHGITYQYREGDLSKNAFFYAGHLWEIKFNILRKSSDLGSHWMDVFIGSQKLSSVVIIDDIFWKVEINSNNSNSNLSYSPDQGITWVHVLFISYNDSHISNPIIFGDDLKIFVTSTSGSDILYFSPNGGKNWVTKEVPLGAGSPKYVNDKLYYAHLKGLYAYDAAEDSFIMVKNGIEGASVNKILQVNDTIWLNTTNNTYKHLYLNNWKEIPGVTATSVTHTGYIIATVNERPKISSNGGLSWQTIPYSRPDMQYWQGHGAAGNVMYIFSYSYAWLSHNYGSSWEEFDAYDLNNVEYNEVYLATSDWLNEILLSQNGHDWTDISFNLKDGLLSSYSETQFHKGHVFATTRNGFYSLFPHSTEWQLKTSPVPSDGQHWFYNLITTMESHGDLLIATLDRHGVYISNDFGETWQPANDGLENLSILSSAIIDDHLYLGVEGGVWRRPLRELQITSSEGNEDETRTVFITYDPVENHFLIVHNDVFQKDLIVNLFSIDGVLKKKIEFLSNDEIQIDAHSLAPGIYVVQCSDGISMKTLKVLKF